MKTQEKLYQDYGTYNILYNQLNMPSPSVEYSWRKTKKLLQCEALRILKMKSGKQRQSISIADLGCGNGALLIRLGQIAQSLGLKAEFSGYDISKSFINYANQAAKEKRISNISFHLLDIEKDNLIKKFDIIICSEVLEHLRSPKKALKKTYNWLKPKGFLLISTPNAKNPIKYPLFFLKRTVSNLNARELIPFLTHKEQTYKLAELEQHLHIFSYGQLKKMLTNSGFTIYKSKRSTTFFGGPFLDNHPLIFAATIIFDSLLDILFFPQIGWDNIIFAQKAK